MGAALRFLAAVFTVFAPVSPTQWWSIARRLSVLHGWMPSMLLWAHLGTLLCFNLGIRRPGNAGGWDLINGLGFVTWAVISVVAMWFTCQQGTRNLRQLGTFGFRRPRWWFEVARMSWNVATVAIVGSLMGMFIPFQLFDRAVAILFSVSRPVFVAFFIFATIGYAISFLQRLPRTGRAYECVNYFYTVGGSLGLLTYAAWRIPPNANLQQMILPALIGTVGIIWFTVGFISIVRRLDAWERHQRVT